MLTVMLRSSVPHVMLANTNPTAVQIAVVIHEADTAE